MSDHVETEPAPLAGVHRLIRVLGRGDGAYPGDLVSCGDGRAVRQDAATLGEWPGWAFADAEHIAGPIDVARRTDGLDVLLPWCTQTLGSWLGQRREQGGPRGETVTAAASIVRGACELAEGFAELTGTWWLTDSGRPVFVLGDGEVARETVRDALMQCAEIADDRALQVLLRDILAGLDRPRVRDADRERWESALFEIAAPRPLRMHTPDGDADVSPRVPHRDVHFDALLRAGAAAERAPARRHRDRRTVLGTFVGPARAVTARRAPRERREPRAMLLLSILRDRVSRRRPAQRRPRAAAEPGRTPRRRLVVVGLAAAVVVLGIGVMLPNADAESSSAKPSVAVAASAPPTPAAAPTVPPPASVPEATPTESGDDPVVAFTTLRHTLRECQDAGDTLCADALAPGARFPAEGRLMDEADSVAMLVEDYGDIAVVRLADPPTDAADGTATRPEQIVVLARLNDTWLIRDVYDVADQPGSG